MERVTASTFRMNDCVKRILIVHCARVRLREIAFNALTMNSLNHGITRY